MGYWQTKVLPQLRKVFDKSGKKAAASEFVKSFDKEEVNKEFEEKKGELEPKVLEIYEAAPAEIKSLVKVRKESGVKKHAAAVTKFLEELVKIDFPGSKAVSEAAEKSGPGLVAGPILFLFEKVATLVPAEAPKEAPAAEAAAEAAAPAEEETAREIAVEEKKEEIEKAAEEAAPAAAESASTEPAPAEPAETEPAKA